MEELIHLTNSENAFGQRRTFLCRDWVFSKMQHCIETRTKAKTCGVLIMGGPGCGKTSICREVVEPSRVPPCKQQNLNSQLLGYHFCIAQDIDSLNVPRFILNIRDQLLNSDSQLTSAYRVLHKEDDINRLFNPARLCNSPDEAFKRGILLPLLSLPPPAEPKFIIVDSIDESCFVSVNDSHQGSKNIAEILATHHQFFPEWLTLVCTCRKQSKSVIRLFTGFRKISLDDLRKNHVIRDVQQYILARLDAEEGLRQHLSQETADMLNLLHIKSNACILYLETVLDGITENFVMLREIVDIPGTLNGLYLWLCQRMFSQHNFHFVRDILNVMLASPRPLTEEAIFAAVWMRNSLLDCETFKMNLSLLHRVLNRTSGGALLLFHHSFAEWLLDVKHCTQTFLCSAPEGHTLLSLSATRRGGELSPEEIREFAHHLVRSSLHSPFQAHHFVIWLIYSGADLDTALMSGISSDLDDWQLDSTAEKLLLAAGAGPTTPELPLDESKETHWNSLQSRFSTLQLDCLRAYTRSPNLFIHPSDSNQLVHSPSNPDYLFAPVSESLLHQDLSNQSPFESPFLPSASPPASSIMPPSIHNAMSPPCLSSSTGMDTSPVALCTASYQGDVRRVGLLLAQGVDVEARDRNGCSPIILAARQGYAAVVDLLIKSGADANHVDNEGWFALRSAAWGGHLEVVDLLLKSGAHVDLTGCDQRTALRAAAWSGHEAIVRRLLAANANVNKADAEGRTSLIAAAYMGHVDIVEILIDHYAHLDHKDREGRTAVSVAALCMPASQVHSVVLSVLLERGACVDCCDQDQVTPLLLAANEGHQAVCELLLDWDAEVDHADLTGRTPLMAAASHGHSGVVKALLFWGAAIHGIDVEGRSVLSVAITQGNPEVVAELLDRGLDEGHKDNSGMTPLHLASLEGHLEAAKLLLEAGARISEQDKDGQTPVLLAAQEGHTALMAYLLDISPNDLEVAAHDGRTPLRAAALENNVRLVEFLLSRGANSNRQDAYGRTTLYMIALDGLLEASECLLTSAYCPADPTISDEEGRCPLHVAAWQGYIHLVKLLIKAGTPVDSKDKEGRTALHSAAWQGHVGVCRVLMEQNCHVEAACSQGATALCIAAQEGHIEVGKLLLQAGGANANHADAYGRTPHRVALKAGHLAMCRLLEEHGASPGSSLTRATPHAMTLNQQGQQQSSPVWQQTAAIADSIHALKSAVMHHSASTQSPTEPSREFSPYASPPVTLDAGPSGGNRMQRGAAVRPTSGSSTKKKRQIQKQVIEATANLMIADGSHHVQKVRAVHAAASNGIARSPSSEDSVDLGESDGSRGDTPQNQSQPSQSSSRAADPTARKALLRNGASQDPSAAQKSHEIDQTKRHSIDSSASSSMSHPMPTGSELSGVKPCVIDKIQTTSTTNHSANGNSSGSNHQIIPKPKPTIHLIVNPGEVLNLNEMTDSEYEDPVWIIQQAQQKHNHHPARTRHQHHLFQSHKIPERPVSDSAGGTGVPFGLNPKKPQANKKISGKGLLGNKFLNMNISRRLHESNSKKADSASLGSHSGSVGSSGGPGKIKIETPL